MWPRNWRWNEQWIKIQVIWISCRLSLEILRHQMHLGNLILQCDIDLLFCMVSRRQQCVKSVHIRSFSGHYFPALRLNTEYLSLFSLNAGNYGPEKLRILPLFMQGIVLWKQIYISTYTTGKEFRKIKVLMRLYS